MSRTYHHYRFGERRIRARGIRQEPPDLRSVALALIELAAETQVDTGLDAPSVKTVRKSTKTKTVNGSPQGESQTLDPKDSA